MDGTAGQENVYQLAFIELAFQAIGVFLNLMVAIFQGFTTDFFQGILGAVTGTSA